MPSIGFSTGTAVFLALYIIRYIFFLESAAVGRLFVLRFEGAYVVAYGHGQGEGVAGEVGLEDGDGVSQTSLEVELHDA